MKLTDDISYLKGVGPQRAQLLGRELGIFTCADLLEHFPFRYVDRSHIATLSTMDFNEPYVVLKGVLRNINKVQSGKFSQRLTAVFRDGTGEMELVWFQGIRWLETYLKPSVEYLIMGKPTMFDGMLQMVHPDIEPFVSDDAGGNHNFVPVYSTTEKLKAKGLNSKGISRLVDTLLRQQGLVVPETIPPYVLKKYNLMPRSYAMRGIHFPSSAEEMQQAMGMPRGWGHAAHKERGRVERALCERGAK